MQSKISGYTEKHNSHMIAGGLFINIPKKTKTIEKMKLLLKTKQNKGSYNLPLMDLMFHNLLQT